MSNNNIIDSSTNSHSVTVYGDVQQGAFSPYAAGGYSTSFSGGSIRTPVNQLDFSGDFTVEGWFNKSANGSGGYDGFFGVGTSGSPPMMMEISTDRGIFFYVNGTAIVQHDPGSSYDPNTSEWTHIALVRESGTTKIYLDGVEVASSTTSYTLDFSSSSDDFYIGSYGGTTYWFNGLICDFRMSSSAVYTSDFTAPTERLTVTSDTGLLACHLPYVGAVANVTTPANVSSSVDETFTPASMSLTANSNDQVRVETTSISPNGNYMAVGAFFESSVANSAGAVKVYDISGSTPSLLYTLNGTNSSDHFGRRVYLSDTQLIVVGDGGGSSTIGNTNDYPTQSTLSSVWKSAIYVYNLATGNQVGVTKKKTGYSFSPNEWAYNVENNILLSFDRESNYQNHNWHRGVWGWDLDDTTTEGPSFHIPNGSNDWGEGTVASAGDWIIVGPYYYDKDGSNNSGTVYVYALTDAINNALTQGTVSPAAELTAGVPAGGSAFGRVVHTDGTNFYASQVRSSVGYLYVYDSSYTLTNTISMGDIDNDNARSQGWYNKPIGSAGNYLFAGIEHEATVAILDKTNSYAKVGEVLHPEGFTSNTSQYALLRNVEHSISSDASKFAFSAVQDPGNNGSPTYTSGAGRAYLYSLSFNAASSSTSSVTLTPSGSVSTERDAPYDFLDYDAATHGGSVIFDGTGDWIEASTGDEASFNIGTDDFTIEFWMNLADVSGSKGLISLIRDHAANENQTPHMYMNNASLVYWVAGSDRITASETFIPNTWYHIAVSKSGSTHKLFVNGVNSGTDWENNYNYAQGRPVIGSYYSSLGTVATTQLFNGHMSDVRIVKGTAVYTADFTPPTSPLTAVTNTSLLLPFDDATIIDRTGSSVLSVVGDTAVATATPPYAGSSYFTFDGSEDRVIAEGADISLAGDFTIEAWIYPEAAGRIIAFPGASYDAGLQISGTSLVFGDGSTNLIAAGSISTGQWYHVAVSKSSGTTKMFVDGTEVGSSTTDNAPIGTSGDLYVGSDTSGNGDFTGSITDVRITTNAEYTSDFTPPNGVWS